VDWQREEFPVTSMAATLGIKAVARDEIGAVQSSLDEEISVDSQ